MSVWRRRALASFPELSRELNDKHEIASVYDLGMEVLARVLDAHRSGGDDDFLRRAYDYAEWCRVQRSQSLWNSVGVSFYEHLPLRPDVVRWLSPGAFDEVLSLAEGRVPREALDEIKTVYADARLRRMH